VSYVARVCAAFVGAFADAIAQGPGDVHHHTIKVVGCVMMFFTDYVEFAGIPDMRWLLAAYAVVGFGAAAYSPAKYGISPSCCPGEARRRQRLDRRADGRVHHPRNGARRGADQPALASLLLASDVPHIDTPGKSKPRPRAAILVISHLCRRSDLNLVHPGYRRALRAPADHTRCC